MIKNDEIDEPEVEEEIHRTPEETIEKARNEDFETVKDRHDAVELASLELLKDIRDSLKSKR